MILIVRVSDGRGKRADGQVMTDPGDIVDTVPDDHVFTPAELGNPDYRFIRVPLVAIEAEAVRAPDRDPITKRAVRARAQGVPLALVSRFKAGEVRDVSRAAFLAAVRRKA